MTKAKKLRLAREVPLRAVEAQRTRVDAGHPLVVLLVREGWRVVEATQGRVVLRPAA